MNAKHQNQGLLISLILTVILLLGPSALCAQTTGRVSEAGDGSQPNGTSDGGSLSADGRFVAFHSQAGNLVPNEMNGKQDIFVRDLRLEKTIRVSVSTRGDEGNGDSAVPRISLFGRYVVFTSEATNLVENDTNSATDVFLHDTATRQTTRISVSSDGQQANGSCAGVGISADGRFIVFSSEANNLVTGDTNGSWDVFVRDRREAKTSRVSLAFDGTQANGDCTNPSISADRSYVAFQSIASNLAQGDTNETWDVFLHHIDDQETVLVSRSEGGAMGNDYSAWPALCPSGSFLSFHSAASNLVTKDSNGQQDVFVYDLESNQIELVSLSSQGLQGNGLSGVSSLSGCGRYVAYLSFADNLVSGDSNSKQDVFVHDRETGHTVRASVSSDGSQPDQLSRNPLISANGRFVVFTSYAANLVNQDTNNLNDVFVHDLNSHDPSANLIFVQFVDGEVGGFHNNSRVILRNNSDLEESGQVLFKDAEGNPAQVMVDDNLSSSIPYSLAAWSSVEFETSGSGSFQTGVIEVSSDLGKKSQIEGTEAFEVLGNFVSVSSSPHCLLSQVYVSVNSNENAGLALYNPHAENAVILELILLNGEGTEKARKRIVLEAGQQLVRFVNEAELFSDFFKDNPGNFKGTLNIRSLCGEVAVLGLLQRRATGALIAVSTSPHPFGASN